MTQLTEQKTSYTIQQQNLPWIFCHTCLLWLQIQSSLAFLNKDVKVKNYFFQESNTQKHLNCKLKQLTVQNMTSYQLNSSMLGYHHSQCNHQQSYGWCYHDVSLSCWIGCLKLKQTTNYSKIYLQVYYKQNKIITTFGIKYDD